MRGKAREEITLVDLLIGGFEKNEVFAGFHWRQLPLADEPAAIRTFAVLCDELRRWKGAPSPEREERGIRIAGWPDVELRQAGRGILLRVRSPWFEWWHDAATWDGDPMAQIFESLERR
jgi:hypothetical protein